MVTFSPVVVYWLYAGFYQLLPEAAADRYRLHARKEAEGKNSVTLPTVVKGVLFQQLVQARLSQVLFLITSELSSSDAAKQFLSSRGCKISDSVIGTRTCIRDGAVIEKSVIMGRDNYQEDVQRSTTLLQGLSIPMGIGEETHIKKAIVDKNARIGKNVRIVNRDGVRECDREDLGYIISGGIVVVLKNAVIPDNSIL